eukprot:1149832-Pelagomonas_calceolata.AAC.2
MKRSLPIPHGHPIQSENAVQYKRPTSLTCSLPDCHHINSTLHILSGCQCPVMRNMISERHNNARRMILKLVSEGSYGAILVQLDAGNTNRVAQHYLQVPEQVSNCAVPSNLVKPTISIQTRRNSSRPEQSWSLLTQITQTDHPLHPQTGYCAVWGVVQLQPAISI